MQKVPTRKRLLIIPARSGSKRVPNKNMYEFDGVPALHRTIKLARDSGLFDGIIVSTDSSSIYQSCLSLGILKSGLRPDFLANDSATVTDVIKYEVTRTKSTQEVYEEVWQLSCFSFMLRIETLERAAIEAQNLAKTEILIGIVKYPVPVEWALVKKSDSKNLSHFSLNSVNQRSQDLREAFYDSGNLAIFNWLTFAETNWTADSLEWRGLEISPTESVDVDSHEDLHMAELLYLGHKTKQYR